MADPGSSRVLVTGGAGFIGRRVVRALMQSGADVTVADKQSFPDGVVDGGVRTVLGDLRDPGVATRALSHGTDAVVHLAALTSVLRSVEDPAGTYEINVAVTASLLELARKHQVETFLFAYTVWGDEGGRGDAAKLLRRRVRDQGVRAALLQRLRSGHGRQGQLRPPAHAGGAIRHRRRCVRRRLPASRSGALGRHRPRLADRVAGRP